jgi:hypothetical protein
VSSPWPAHEQDLTAFEQVAPQVIAMARQAVQQS